MIALSRSMPPGPNAIAIMRIWIVFLMRARLAEAQAVMLSAMRNY